MNIHKNARLTPLRREEMALSVIEGSLSKAHAARIYGVSPKIVARWVERYRSYAELATDLLLLVEASKDENRLLTLMRRSAGMLRSQPGGRQGKPAQSQAPSPL